MAVNVQKKSPRRRRQAVTFARQTLQVIKNLHRLHALQNLHRHPILLRLPHGAANGAVHFFKQNIFAACQVQAMSVKQNGSRNFRSKKFPTTPQLNGFPATRPAERYGGGKHFPARFPIRAERAAFIRERKRDAFASGQPTVCLHQRQHRVTVGEKNGRKRVALRQHLQPSRAVKK